MKNILIFITLFLFILIYGCDTSKSDNSNISTVKLSITAESTVAYRAIGAKEPDKKVQNPDYLAPKFVNPQIWSNFMGLSPDFNRSIKIINQKNISSYYGVLVRTKHIDEILKQSLSNGYQQVVNLGAGYDSRAYRFHESFKNVKFFEVDTIPMSKEKRNRVVKIFGKLPEYVSYVAIDFNKQTIKDALENAGYDKTKKTFFIWEGVTYYISEQAVLSTLKFVSQNSCPGSSIIFDYVYKSIINGTHELSLYVNFLLNYLKQIGEPWIFGLEKKEAEKLIKELGLEIVSDLGHEKLNKMYLIKSDGTSYGHFYDVSRIMHARVLNNN